VSSPPQAHDGRSVIPCGDDAIATGRFAVSWTATDVLITAVQSEPQFLTSLGQMFA